MDYLPVGCLNRPRTPNKQTKTHVNITFFSAIDILTTSSESDIYACKNGTT